MLGKNGCDKVSLEGFGKIYEHIRGRIILYIPTDVHKDSAFPFHVGEKVKVKIESKRLIVEKIKK